MINYLISVLIVKCLVDLHFTMCTPRIEAFAGKVGLFQTTLVKILALVIVL